MVSNHFTTNVSQNAAVKKFWKSVNSLFGKHIDKTLWLTFFLGHPVCRHNRNRITGLKIL